MSSDTFVGFLVGAIPVGIGIYQLIIGEIWVKFTSMKWKTFTKEEIGADFFYAHVFAWIGCGMFLWLLIFHYGPEQCRKENLKNCQGAECSQKVGYEEGQLK